MKELTLKHKAKKHHFLFFAFAFCLLTFYFSCEKDYSAITVKKPPERPKPEISLSLHNQPGHNIIKLKLEIKNLSLPQAFILTRNDTIIFNDSIAVSDTILTDVGLSRETTYRYRAYRTTGGVKSDSSNLVEATTLPYASHEFSWEFYEFGEGVNGSWRDVFIIHEDDIWVVGEVLLRDSSGNPIWPIYNAAHWDGLQWELKRITVMYLGSPVTAPLEGVFAFSPTDIWVSAGVPHHGDGQNWQLYHLFDMGVLSQDDGSVYKIWGSSPNNLYFAGLKGTIVHYDGSNWLKLPRVTDVHIQDIWGAHNSLSGELEILAIASYRHATVQAKELLQVQGTQVSILSSQGLPLNLKSAWFIPNQKYYTTGDGVYYNTAIGQPWLHDPNHPLVYKDAIRGNDEEDIIIAGSFGFVSHFNGQEWYNYQSEVPGFYGRYHRVAVKGNLVVAVGTDAGVQAVILMGRRYQY